MIREAQKQGIIPASTTVERIQGNADRYVEAAVAIVSWARGRDLEPRDLDVYWYLTGTESLRPDGICRIAEGDDVWWCYDGGDCVDPKQDWLGGTVVKCALPRRTSVSRSSCVIPKPKRRSLSSTCWSRLIDFASTSSAGDGTGSGMMIRQNAPSSPSPPRLVHNAR